MKCNILLLPTGGEANVVGTSSGSALALEAAHGLGAKMTKLGLYKVPYNDDPAARTSWAHFAVELRSLLAADRRADALVRFMHKLDTPSEQIAGMRGSPVWSMLEAVAPTLAYDIAILGNDNAIPADRVAMVTVSTLMLDGGASYPFIHATAQGLARLLPQAEHRMLQGQTHVVKAEELATVLNDFFVS